eukprot:gene21231-23307_t
MMMMTTIQRMPNTFRAIPAPRRRHKKSATEDENQSVLTHSLTHKSQEVKKTRRQEDKMICNDNDEDTATTVANSTNRTTATVTKSSSKSNTMATVATATATRSVYKIKRLNKQLQAATANTRRVKQTLRQMLQLFIRHSNQSAELLKRAEDKNKILYSTVATQIEVNARLREQLEQQPSPPPPTTATDLSQKCCCCCRLHSHNNTTADRRHHVSGGGGGDDKDEAISITSSVDDFLESNNSSNSDDDDNIETYNPPSDGFSQKIMFNIPARHDDDDDDDSLMKERKSDNDDSITEALHQLTENNK